MLGNKGKKRGSKSLDMKETTDRKRSSSITLDEETMLLEESDRQSPRDEPGQSAPVSEVPYEHLFDYNTIIIKNDD